MGRSTRKSMLFLMLGGMHAGCAHTPIAVDGVPEAPSAPALYRVQAGDRLMVSVWSQAQLSGEYGVRPDGRMTMPLIGDIAAAGFTTTELAEHIAAMLDGLVLNPKVTVALRSMRQALVSVLGEVRAPGQFELRDNEEIIDVLARAGGLTEFAHPDRIYVLRRDNAVPRLRFTYDDLTARQGKLTRFCLKDGDIVIVE